MLLETDDKSDDVESFETLWFRGGDTESILSIVDLLLVAGGEGGDLTSGAAGAERSNVGSSSSEMFELKNVRAIRPNLSFSLFESLRIAKSSNFSFCFFSIASF